VAEPIPAKRTPERRLAPGEFHPIRWADRVSLSRSGWPGAGKTPSHRGFDTAPRHRAAAVRARDELAALNLGSGHGDAGQRGLPPLRTTHHAGLTPALCERHDDTSSADGYDLLY
jgi:hypothetical protein